MRRRPRKGRNKRGSARFLFTRTGTDWMLDVQHGRGACPGVFVDAQFGFGRQAAVAGRTQRLRDGGMFHHDAAIKRRTTGSAVEPND